MIIQYVNQQTRHPAAPWRALLDRVMPEAFAASAFGRQLARRGINASVTITFAGPRRMRRINRETRQVDRLTDVLSFPLLNMAAGHLAQPLAAEDFDLAQPEARVVPLGDIIISLDKAFEQAEEYGHSAEREVAFLAVHGLLHLQGFDHLTPADEKKMQPLQKKILDQMGLGRGEHHE